MMENQVNRQQGSLKISEEVIATIAKLATVEIEGVDELAPVQRSVKEMISKTKKEGAIKVTLFNDVAQISVSVNVKKGYKVTTVAENIQKSVKQAVQSMAGIAVSKVNVIIAGVAITQPQSK